MKKRMQKLLLFGFIIMQIGINAQELIPYRKGNLWGYANKSGIVKIKCTYNKVSTFKGEFAYVFKEGKRGIINSRGKEVLALKNWISFSKVKNKNSFLIINHLKQYGVINGEGKIVIPFGKYEKIQPFNSFGITQVNNGNLFGVINYLGKEILPLDSYDNIYLDNKTDYLYLNKNDKCMFLSPKGELLSNKKYENISALKGTNNYFIVYSRGSYGVLDFKGQEIIPVMYDRLHYGGEEIFMVKKNGKWIYITNKNKTIIQQLDALEPFVSGYAKVIKEGKYGIVNKQGKLIVDFGKYDDVRDNENGLFVVKKEGELGVVNVDGVEIVAPKYQKISNFKGGFAVVSLEGKYGIINAEGREIKACKYEELRKVHDKGLKASIFVKDSMYVPSKKVLVRYKEKGKYGLFNSKGKQLLKAAYHKINLEYAHANVLLSRQDVKSKKTLLGYYNVDKEMFITDIIYKQAKPFESKHFSVAEVQLQNNARTVINAIGEQVIPAELYFQKIQQINNSHLLVKSNTFSFGLYNIAQKKYSVPLGKYSSLTPSLDAQFFCVGIKVKEQNRTSTKYGVINVNGKEITPVKYDKVQGVFNGDFVKNNSIEVKLEGKNGYVNTSGKEFF